MTSRGTCLDVSSVLFRPIDGRGTQYVVRCPGTDGAATSGYGDTGISLRAADQLVNVVVTRETGVTRLDDASPKNARRVGSKCSGPSLHERIGRTYTCATTR